MDSAYYKLIEEANEISRLCTAVVKYADYKPAIKAATDVVIIDAIRELQRAQQMLREVQNRQEYANVLSMPG